MRQKIIRDISYFKLKQLELRYGRALKKLVGLQSYLSWAYVIKHLLSEDFGTGQFKLGPE